MHVLEAYFNRFMFLKDRIHSLAEIVQNPNMEITDEEFLKWTNEKNEIMNALNSLSYDIGLYYKKI